ncbi:1-acyl-sn-glycerol-3-phosphate acyltransferase [Flavobacterium sp.]|uniref:1-acyl-sn-glycerol-3-phosphate acyltransferase n=1 Tax=Flavobacterium sp. TaxID=239 RepID=UPI00286BB05D|nr:1-acyl-sn-glycerol-3-phosphate acyltransferase [Flavobacterium sp.]
MKKSIYKFIFFNLMGWKVTGTFDENIKKCVVMVIPHTSWHDFYLGIFTRGVLGLEINYVGKKELFTFPFGYYFKYTGGEPLDRSGGLNRVDSIAAIFKKRAVFRLAISPEGTRKKVDKLRTGFYFIALKAEVPIFPIAFNYEKKEIQLGTPFTPTGDYDNDLPILLQQFKGSKGKYPEKGFEV